MNEFNVKDIKLEFEPIKELENGSNFIVLDVKDFDLKKLNKIILNDFLTLELCVRDDEEHSRYIVKNYVEGVPGDVASALNKKYIGFIKDLVANNHECYKFIVTKKNNFEVQVALTRFITEEDLKEDEDFLKVISKDRIKKKTQRMGLYRNFKELSHSIDLKTSSILTQDETLSKEYIAYIPYLKSVTECNSDDFFKTLTSDVAISLFHNKQLD